MCINLARGLDRRVTSRHLYVGTSTHDVEVLLSQLGHSHNQATRSDIMAATDVGTRNVPPIDDMDDSLFDYNVGDVFHDVDTNMDVPAVQRSARRAGAKEDGADLGIDEEIKVTKSRVPVPKLDINKYAPIEATTVDQLLNGS